MKCPCCGYRYSFWKFFCITNPWKIICRGCGEDLCVRGTTGFIVSLILLTIAFALPLAYFARKLPIDLYIPIVMIFISVWGMAAEVFIYLVGTFDRRKKSSPAE